MSCAFLIISHGQVMITRAFQAFFHSRYCTKYLLSWRDEEFPIEFLENAYAPRQTNPAFMLMPSYLVLDCYNKDLFIEARAGCQAAMPTV